MHIIRCLLRLARSYVENMDVVFVSSKSEGISYSIVCLNEMFLVLLQAIAQFLSDVYQYILTAIVGKDDSKKSDWANDTYHPDYFQPQYYNAHQGLQTNFRQRGFPIDVDRNTNQTSQSSATTLPRPFYAAVRQHNAPNNLVNRAGQGQIQQKQKQSVVELLLQQQSETVVQESVPLLQSSSIENQSFFTQAETTERSTPPHEEKFDTTISFGDSVENIIKSSVPSYKYEPPRLLSPSEKLGGLRGSRPLVKLDRMSFITKMMREGKHGESMGDYAPDSRLHSVNLGDSSPVQNNGEEAVSAAETPPTLHHLSSAYPTLDLKDLSLLDIVGGGGFGQVWRGAWGGTPVAVKLLSNLLLPAGSGTHHNAEQAALLTAFEEEVSMLAQLRHPNICLFLGVCLEPPHRAIVTELVSRGSLWDCLRVKGLFQVCYKHCIS